MTRQDDDRRHGQWKYSMPQGRVWARGSITQRYWDNPITKETNWGFEGILAMQICVSLTRHDDDARHGHRKGSFREDPDEQVTHTFAALA